MPIFTDQTGRTLSLPQTPRRIISLVPSQTELLYALGLQEEVVGLTKFCVHPEPWFRNKTRVGGTKDLRPDIIHQLQPDLIIANKEENDREQVEALALRYPVWVSDVNTLPGALHMIRSVGQLTGKDREATRLADAIENSFRDLGNTPGQPPPSNYHPLTTYFIWRNPWMVAGGDTFIHDMLRHCGLVNVFGEQSRYPSIELDSLPASGCQLVLLSSEPFPFKVRHIQEIRAVLPDACIRLVDGELFSWYGSRLLKAPAYFRELRTNLENFAGSRPGIPLL